MSQSNEEPPHPPASLDEYSLAPEDPLPELVSPLRAPKVESHEPLVDSERDQFSVGELLGLVAAMAVLLSVVSSIVRCTSTGGESLGTLAAIYAAVFGFAAMANILALGLMPHARRIVWMGWWVLLGLYIFMAAVAGLISK